MRSYHWFYLGVGVWLAASPWILGFSAVNTAMFHSLFIGIVLILISVWALYGSNR